MTNPNEVTSLANDLRDKMHDLGLFPQDDTMRRLAIWLVKRMPAAAPARTDVEIVQQTNALARLMLPHIGTGYSVPDGYKFYEERHKHPRAAKCWNAAVEIMEFMTQTNADDALSGVEPGEMDQTAPAAAPAPAVSDADETLRRELRQLARELEVQIAHARQREIDLRNAFEPAFAQMAAAIAKLTGEAPQAPTEG